MAAERLRLVPGSVRVRTTVAAVAVVGVAMVVGAVVLVVVLRSTLTREVRAAARLRAEDVAAVLAAGAGSGAAGPGTLAVDEADELLIQVLDGGGRVVAASPNAQGRPPVARLRPGSSAEVEVPAGGPMDESGEFLAVATGADTPQGPRTVLVARSTEAVGEAVAAVSGLLAVGLPLLLVVVAVTTWVVVGRALAPVEAMRAEVDEISAAALHRRVPDPPADDEIGRLARTVNRMLGRLEQAQTRQRRLVADASHGLRSPVATIRQHAEVALAHPGRTSASRAGLHRARRGPAAPAPDRGPAAAHPGRRAVPGLWRRPVDLDDLVFEEAKRLRDATGLRVDTSAVSAGRVAGDAAGLRRVLRNLGDNASRHARERLALSVAERDATVVLAVEDDGSGIPEADRERVFERFVRLDGARARDDGGGGLGLAIVAELVTAHGGTVVAAAGTLGGARVEVILPRLADREG